MESPNAAVKRPLFTEKISSGQPVNLTNLNKGTGDISFFNYHRGSRVTDAKSISFKFTENAAYDLIKLKDKTSGMYDIQGQLKWLAPQRQVLSRKEKNVHKELREAVINDGTAHYIISIWGEMIEQIEESKCYSLSDCVLKDYFGQQLSTLPHSVLKEVKIDRQIKWDEINLKDIAETLGNKGQSSVDKPDITGVVLSFYAVCTNKNCKKKVTLPAGEKIVRCEYCERTMLSDKCKTALSGIVDIAGDNVCESLTVFPDVLTKYFGEDVNKLTETESLMEKLLMLQNVRITYNTKNVITNIENLE